MIRVSHNLIPYIVDSRVGAGGDVLAPAVIRRRGGNGVLAEGVPHRATCCCTRDGNKRLLRAVVGSVVRGDSSWSAVCLADRHDHVLGRQQAVISLCRCYSDIGFAIRRRNCLDCQRAGRSVHIDIVLAAALDRVTNRTFTLCRVCHAGTDRLVGVTICCGHIGSCDGLRCLNTNHNRSCRACVLVCRSCIADFVGSGSQSCDLCLAVPNCCP